MTTDSKENSESSRRTPTTSCMVGRRVRRILLATVALSPILTLSVKSAWAATGHGAPSFSQITHYWFNFLLYVLIMYMLLRSVVTSAWALRREQIRGAVRRSASELQRAEDELREAETLSRSVVTAENAAREEISRQAESEASAIINSATDKAERIHTQARELVAAETRAAEIELREELVARAVEIAKQRFLSGDLATRQASYEAAAVSRARRLVQ